MTATMTDTLVTLRKGFPVALGVKLWRWLNAPRDPNFDDFGPRDAVEFNLHLARRIERETTWAICVGGEIVGYLAFAQQSPVTGQMHGMVLDPAYRGRGLGTMAMRAAIEELAETGVRSILVMPFLTSDKAIRMLHNSGFRMIGMVRNGTQRDGKPLGVAIMTWEVD